MIELLQHFPDATLIRRGNADACYGDKDVSPGCGFFSIQESVILSNAARAHSGTWCEIGSHAGWSAAVIAQTGCRVVMVDPEYGPGATAGARKRAIANLRRAGLLNNVEMVGKTSADFFAANTRFFAGIVIDGCHDAPEPTRDAEAAINALMPGGTIVLHDYAGQPVKDAVRWLVGLGFEIDVHDTINGLAVARRRV